MRNIAVIPARGGSKRLPGKNLLPLGGKPLIAYSIEMALASAIIDQTYVSTDDAEIADVAMRLGAEVIIRPAEISGDNEPTVTAIKHVLEQTGSNANVFILQPTNPLRPANLVQEAYDHFVNSNADSLMTVSPNRHKLGRIRNNRFIPETYEMGERSQDLDPLYYENGRLYIANAAIVREGKLLAGNNFAMIVDHPYAEVDIDTKEDFDFAEYLLARHKASL